MYPTTGADTNQPQERRNGERFATIPGRREVKPMQKKLTKVYELRILRIQIILIKVQEIEDNKKTATATVAVKSSKG